MVGIQSLGYNIFYLHTYSVRDTIKAIYGVLLPWLRYILCGNRGNYALDCI